MDFESQVRDGSWSQTLCLIFIIVSKCNNISSDTWLVKEVLVNYIFPDLGKDSGSQEFWLFDAFGIYAELSFSKF